MSTLIFDTHKFITNMTNVGMPQPQAEVLAESHVELMETTLATKQDLKDRKTDLAGEMRDIGSRLTREMQAIKAELSSKIDQAVIQIIGTITAVMVGLAALMAFFMTCLKL